VRAQGVFGGYEELSGGEGADEYDAAVGFEGEGVGRGCECREGVPL
jgi:hypothetical protein